MKRTAAALAVTAVLLWLTLTYKSSSGPSTALGLPSTSATVRATRKPSAGPPRRGAGRSNTPSSTTPTRRTITGSAISNKYGDVQVAVTLSGARIVDVQTLVVPSSHGDSRRINARAVPLLRAEAIQVQSAQIHTVTGATYTSVGYAQSLQSAIDQSHG